MNEKIKLKHAAHITAGPMIGAQRCLNLPNIDFPCGKNLICSSQDLSKVDNVGSTNLITKDVLNHA